MAVSLIDAPGGQRRVETGVGTVEKLEPGSRNTAVTIKADHLRLPVTAWADGNDAGLIAALEGAMASRQRVEYRVEVKRKPKIDAAVPLDDVDKFDRVRDLVSITPAGATVSGASSSAGTAAAPPAGVNTPPPERSPDDDPGPTEPGAAAPAGVVVEGRPWQRCNSDGSPNLGSYAMQATVGMTEFAHRLQVDHRQRAGEPGLPTENQIRGLARHLLNAADLAQAELRTDGKADRMDASHARARGAVRLAVEVLPVPWDAQTAVERQTWAESVAAYAATLLRVAVELDR